MNAYVDSSILLRLVLTRATRSMADLPPPARLDGRAKAPLSDVLRQMRDEERR
jgi:hypothetical protein